jgi:hypothetical protein
MNLPPMDTKQDLGSLELKIFRLCEKILETILINSYFVITVVCTLCCYSLIVLVNSCNCYMYSRPLQKHQYQI